MFLHLAVILFTGGGGGLPNPPDADSLGLGRPPPGCRPPGVGQTPPGCRPPRVGQTPPMQIPLDADPPDTVNKRAVRILLECILVAIYVNITFARCIQIKTASRAEKLNQFQYINTCTFWA